MLCCVAAGGARRRLLPGRDGVLPRGVRQPRLPLRQRRHGVGQGEHTGASWQSNPRILAGGGEIKQLL